MFQGEVILILRMDHLGDYCSSGGWQTAWSQKNSRARASLSASEHPHVAEHIGPFLPRTLLCGCISSSSSLGTGPFLFFVLLPLVPSLLLDAIWSYTKLCCLRITSDAVCILCTRACAFALSVLIFHIVSSPSKCYDYTFVCIKENACESLPVLLAS